MVDAFPLAPRFVYTLPVLDEVASPSLFVRLSIKDESNTDGKPKSPDSCGDDKECLPCPGRRRYERECVEIYLEHNYGHIRNAMQIDTLQAKKVVNSTWRASRGKRREVIQVSCAKKSRLVLWSERALWWRWFVCSLDGWWGVVSPLDMGAFNKGQENELRDVCKDGDE